MITRCPICSNPIKKWHDHNHDVGDYEVQYYWGSNVLNWMTGIIPLDVYTKGAQTKIYERAIYLEGIIPLDKERIETIFLLK